MSEANHGYGQSPSRRDDPSDHSWESSHTTVISVLMGILVGSLLAPMKSKGQQVSVEGITPDESTSSRSSKTRSAMGTRSKESAREELSPNPETAPFERSAKVSELRLKKIEIMLTTLIAVIGGVFTYVYDKRQHELAERQSELAVAEIQAKLLSSLLLDDEASRKAAAAAAAVIEDSERFVPILVANFGAEKPNVGENARKAVQDLYDLAGYDPAKGPSKRKAIVEVIGKNTTNVNPNVRSGCARLLGDLPNSQGLDYLLEMIKRGDDKEGVITNVCTAVLHIDPPQLPSTFGKPLDEILKNYHDSILQTQCAKVRAKVR